MGEVQLAMTLHATLKLGGTAATFLDQMKYFGQWVLLTSQL